MNKIKFLKRYTYTSISNFDFNILIFFDYDSNTLLYSLEYDDINYHDSIDYLIEYASSLSDDAINESIRKFMLIHVWNEIDTLIILNDFNEWKVEIIENGLKLINKVTKQYATWNIYNYDEDYEAIQNAMEKFLKLQHNL